MHTRHSEYLPMPIRIKRSRPWERRRKAAERAQTRRDWALMIFGTGLWIAALVGVIRYY